MINNWRKSVCLALLASLLATASAQQAQHKVHVDFREATLKNGLRVQLAEDHSAPVVSINITYDVGSRNEREGRTGFAHLFEHMMFKGSQNVGNGEHMYLLSNVGANFNGTTTPDRTIYYDTVPSNQLEMILFLESDRMRGLDITQVGLDNQRHAVQEERRQFTDNQPYGKAEERQQELLYDDFGYHHTTIGSMEDLNAASVEDVAQFFKTYYAPNNAVLSLVGDFNSAYALARIKKYFEDIPRNTPPPDVHMNEPEQSSERRATVNDPLARLAQVRLAFKAVPGNTPDFYPLLVLSAVLQIGQSSRLYQKLVKERELVTNVFGYMDERRGPSALYTTATLRPGKRTEDVEAAIYEEIERLMREPIADWELEKAKNSARLAYVNAIQNAQSRAITLGIFTVFYNDPNLINTRLDLMDAVTKADVERVAQKYLKPTNRTVVITVPQAQSAPRTSTSGN
ncbi:MAG: hypothetical protein AUG51_08235 [Acidobacteria bacterium 13_1_20CM_3_53_8]|nr:MAG: hypothetical protein AUG51_08235 [Acidobacteria bacterium 13_1_20CM_3_53_8]